MVVEETREAVKSFLIREPTRDWPYQTTGFWAKLV